MTSNRCIVSCCYSDDGRYLQYGKRLVDTLRSTGNYQGAIKMWDQSFPPGSPTHRENHYAFKHYAVKWAIDQGYDEIMWLDAGCYAVAEIEPLWAAVHHAGVYLVAGTEPLGEWISDQALAYFCVSRNEAMTLQLCGGAVIGVCAKRMVGQWFMFKWKELADSGLFITAHSKYAPDKMKSLWVSDLDEKLVISEDPRVKGHRSDEACFSLVLDQLGLSPEPVEEWNKFIRSGYNL